MWHSIIEVVSRFRTLSRPVTCARRTTGSECLQGKVHVPASLVGNRVYIVPESTMYELERRAESLDAMRRFFISLLNTEKGRRMFTIVSETWNPVTGCEHDCIYCWARQLALTKLKNSKRYSDGFKPRLNREEFKKKFKGGVVFVSDMGDLWGEWVPGEWVEMVLNHIRKYTDTWFLFLTKNPQRYHEFLDKIPSNAILGATIETNRSEYYTSKYNPRISKAPTPYSRYKAMKDLNWPLKFVSIEPILDFDLDEFTRWIEDINPFMVYIGYDNYKWKLPEPPLNKTLELISRLEDFTLVIKKTIRPAWNEGIIRYVEGKPLDSNKKEKTKEKTYLSRKYP